MRKILLRTSFAILFLAFSLSVSEAKVSLKPTGLGRIESKRIPVDRNSPEKLSKQFAKGLTYYKNYSNLWSNLSSDYSLGSSVFTFTASRGASTPATYIDSNGVIQLVTTSDIPRNQGGYYNATGFHSQKGVMIEAAGTNRATYSGTPENAAWVKTNVTADNDDAGSTSPDGVATSNSLTALANNGTFVQTYAITGDPATYTASAWVKRKTGTGVVDLGAVEDGTGKTAITLPANTWVRVSVTATTDGDDAGKDPAFYLELESNADAVYVYGMQLELNPYMTSYIPTTTAALTRNAEILKYLIANNRTAAQESIYIKFAPCSDFANDGVGRYIIDTDTKQRRFHNPFNFSQTKLVTYPNATDNNLCICVSTTTPLKNVSYLFTSVFQKSSPYNVLYNNGIVEKTQSSNAFTTEPSWGSNFYLGCQNSSLTQFNGIIESVAIFSTPHTAAQVADETNLLN